MQTLQRMQKMLAISKERPRDDEDHGTLEGASFECANGTDTAAPADYCPGTGKKYRIQTSANYQLGY